MSQAHCLQRSSSSYKRKTSQTVKIIELKKATSQEDRVINISSLFSDLHLQKNLRINSTHPVLSVARSFYFTSPVFFHICSVVKVSITTHPPTSYRLECVCCNPAALDLLIFISQQHSLYTHSFKCEYIVKVTPMLLCSL